jgi:hypothetical protein
MNASRIRFTAITILDIALLFTAPLLIRLIEQLP